MEPLNIEIRDLTLDTVVGAEYDGALTLGDMIVERAARNLTKDSEYGEVASALRKRIGAIRDEEIRALVRAELAEAMQAPVTATNQWGEPTGQPTTLRALVVEAATKFFTEKRSRDTYGREPKMTDAERVIGELIKAELTKELAAVFAAEKAKVVSAVQAKAGELLAQAVKDGLR